ncbi:MAG: GlxA family transcriptional regulator [Alphaproteobacteria bacterium]
MDRTSPSTFTVGLVVVPETAPAALYALKEVFAFTGMAWESLTGRPTGDVRLVPILVGECRGLSICALDVPVAVEAAFDDAIHCTVVIASDLALAPDADPRGRWPQAARWLRGQFDDGAIVGSVCTGSLLLAEAGLLDELEATTHWGAVSTFEHHYPRVRLRPERVLSLAGPEQRLITSGGHGSWTELALYLVERLCGRSEAIRTSKVFLIGDRRDGQLPFAAMARPRRHDDAVIADCQEWIASHYREPGPVAAMVARSRLAPRTFARRFRSATGYAAIAYVQTLRVEEAKQLLETTATATDAIAAEVGYEDPSSFRRVFRRLTGVSPARYRRRIAAIVRPAADPADPGRGRS